MKSFAQVLVIGGGPAGSTTASFLAREGFDVLLIERDVFPRYHIGESLLPSCLEVLDLIGAREKIENYGFQRKGGGYFAWGKDSWVLDFAPLRHPYSFQVVRSEFDHLMLEHAKSQGVTVWEGTEIRSLSFDGDRPRSATWAQVAGGNDTGEVSFDYLVDASGRAGVMAMRYQKDRHYHSAFQNVAVWGYWEGAGRMSFAPEGAIANGSVPDGWLWGIPLHNGTMSVGLVLHKDTFKEKRQSSAALEQIYLEAIDQCPLIKDLLKSAKLVTQVKTEQDYSYVADTLAGPGYFIVGDAACFIDPLLSTGVHLATHSAMLCAACIASIERGEVTAQQATTFFAESYRRTYLRLMVVVGGLYQQYNGKETYFWQAQQLTDRDYNDHGAMIDAFLYVVSGIEDQKDAGTINPKQIDVPDRMVAFSGIYHKVVYQASMSPQTANDGLYVVTQPRLGLAHTEKDLSLVHQAEDS